MLQYPEFDTKVGVKPWLFVKSYIISEAILIILIDFVL